MTDTTGPRTADLWDAHAQRLGDELQVGESIFADFGGVLGFSGPVRTVRVHEDNRLVRGLLDGDGKGAVLVVDGGGSTYCALIGDRLAQLALTNGWAGLVINGCVRDSETLADLPIGIKALGTSPRKSRQVGPETGLIDAPAPVAGIVIRAGAYLYADADGILVAPEALEA